MLQDQYYMNLVLDLAKSTKTQTLPNPQVASIIVNNSQVVGVGCHLRAGSHHAEIYALQQAGDYAKGATLYVNLEPCAHFGKTPPCVDAIINAGIKRVVVATIDENPLVSGHGVQKLRDAGIEVLVGVLAQQAYQLNEVFFHNIKTRQPYITIKVGMSLDGKIATKSNISQWITSAESRKDAHSYRISHSAILVGVETVLKDDPSLTAHLVEDNQINPTRIILDSKLRTPLNAKVITDQSTPSWIVTCSDNKVLISRYQQQGVTILSMSDMRIETILNRLHTEGIYSILVEGGERVYSSFIDAGMINQVICYISPQLIGSASAKHFFAGNGFSDLTSNLKLKLEHCSQLGDDIKLIYKKV